MARGKVQMRRIENSVHRQVTFCKRRVGLLKKARELSVLCDADVALIIFSGNGKCFEMATRGTMQEMIERYMKSCANVQTEVAEESNTKGMENEVLMLKQEIDLLRKGLRYIFGNGMENMSLNELQAVERHLEIWMYHIRATKMRLIFQEIELLKNKEHILKTANETLQRKITEQKFTQIEPNGFVEFDPTIADFCYPLTVDNEFFQFQGDLI